MEFTMTFSETQQTFNADFSNLQTVTTEAVTDPDPEVSDPTTCACSEYFNNASPDTLTWDGNTNGLEGVDVLGSDGTLLFYCISSATPTLSELTASGGSVTFEDSSAEKSTQATVYGVEEVSPGLTLVVAKDADNNAVILYVATEECIGVELETGAVIHQTGTYFCRLENDETVIYVSSFTINGYTGFGNTKLKAEHLPNLVVDIGAPTIDSGGITISDVSYTPIYEAIKSGVNVTLKLTSPTGIVLYAAALSTGLTDDGLIISIILETLILAVLFTTA